ncbi:MAG TPA: T3SS effector HopA1 family protein [Blastococcus sp.]|nr:T3SS effector HopA1 family protein [Blastococcus sp.]
MPTALALPTPDGPMSRVPSLEVLARISEETELGDGTTALTDAIHARYFRGSPGTSGTESPGPGRRGRDFCRRLADTFTPYLFRRDAWRFSYRTTDGIPSFVVAAGSPVGGETASCFLHLRPGTAPDLFARVVTTLDGYGLDFRAELAGDPEACRRADAAVLTVHRDDIPAVARVALRLEERAPFALDPAVPAFTRQVAPGVALADQPGGGTSFGRHRSRLIAAGLVAAGSGAGPAHRRAAVLASLTKAGLDPAALHVNPGNPDFRV